jgi:Ca-activated chloride channel family protein
VAPTADPDELLDAVDAVTIGGGTRGVTPAQAAEQAAERGVLVYAIGFGTTNQTQMVHATRTAGYQQPRIRELAGSRGGAMGGRSFPVVDEAARREVTETLEGSTSRPPTPTA